MYWARMATSYAGRKSSAKTPMMMRRERCGVEIGLGVRALEAELLKRVLVAIKPEKRPLLDALERLL